MASEVRIIGGKWKGRKVRFAPVPGVRPTLGAARETLFNWLTGELDGARCLDLFAGSGALGFEALSRGAAHVTFVDQQRRVADTLRNQVVALDAAAEVIRADARIFLKRALRRESGAGGFDLIFLDPPFDRSTLEQVLALPELAGLLARNGRIYVEFRRASAPAWPGWSWVKQSRAGEASFGLLARAS